MSEDIQTTSTTENSSEETKQPDLESFVFSKPDELTIEACFNGAPLTVTQKDANGDEVEVPMKIKALVESEDAARSLANHMLGAALHSLQQLAAAQAARQRIVTAKTIPPGAERAMKEIEALKGHTR